MNRSIAWMAAAFLAVAAAPLAAQTLKSVKVQPATAKPGETVSVISEYDISQGLNCTVRVHYGDGATEDLHVNQEKDARITTSHKYAKPGSYTVMVEPKTNLPNLKCLGANQRAKVKVVAPPPPKPVAAAKQPTCPSGWKLDPKSVNAKTGGFVCTAAANSPAPSEKLACPGQLGYYENLKKGRIDCRP